MASKYLELRRARVHPDQWCGGKSSVTGTGVGSASAMKKGVVVVVVVVVLVVR